MEMYNKEECFLISRKRENFDDFSIESLKYQLTVNGVTFNTLKALYHTCQFTKSEVVQKKIIEASDTNTIDQICIESKHLERADWAKIKLDILEWCLKLKIAQYHEFKDILWNTDKQTIVFEDEEDIFLGVKVSSSNSNVLLGENYLGKLLMDVRNFSILKPDHIPYVTGPRIDDFFILGRKYEEDAETIKFMKAFYNRLAFEFYNMREDQGL